MDRAVVGHDTDVADAIRRVPHFHLIIHKLLVFWPHFHVYFVPLRLRIVLAQVNLLDFRIFEYCFGVNPSKLLNLAEGNLLGRHMFLFLKMVRSWRIRIYLSAKRRIEGIRRSQCRGVNLVDVHVAAFLGVTDIGLACLICRRLLKIVQNHVESLLRFRIALGFVPK